MEINKKKEHAYDLIFQSAFGQSEAKTHTSHHQHPTHIWSRRTRTNNNRSLIAYRDEQARFVYISIIRQCHMQIP